jgi:hypothetical protein
MDRQFTGKYYLQASCIILEKSGVVVVPATTHNAFLFIQRQPRGGGGRKCRVTVTYRYGPLCNNNTRKDSNVVAYRFIVCRGNQLKMGVGASP